MLLTPQSQNTSFFDKLNSISPTSPISKVLKTVIQAITITLIILSTQSATAINSINHTYDDQLALSKYTPLTHTNSAYNTPTPTTPESSLPTLNQRHEIYSYQTPTPHKHLRHLTANFLQRTETKPSTSPTATYNITVLFLSSSVSTQPNKGLHHYKYRHYSAELGRWPSRDPIEEKGGVNLYGFVGNNGINKWDRLGHSDSERACMTSCQESGEEKGECVDKCCPSSTPAPPVPDCKVISFKRIFIGFSKYKDFNLFSANLYRTRLGVRFEVVVNDESKCRLVHRVKGLVTFNGVNKFNAPAWEDDVPGGVGDWWDSAKWHKAISWLPIWNGHGMPRKDWHAHAGNRRAVYTDTIGAYNYKKSDLPIKATGPGGKGRFQYRAHVKDVKTGKIVSTVKFSMFMNVTGVDPIKGIMNWAK